MAFDQTKFEILVLHVIWKAGHLRDFGSTKLNKVLWFSDARAFEALGKSITGETYIRQKHGPVPKHVQSAIDHLRATGLIRVWSEPYFDFEVTRFEAHQPPDMSSFSVEELGFIDWWIKHISEEHTAGSISEESHDYGWKLANQGEEMPMHAFLAKRVRPPKTPDEIAWARDAAARLGTKE